MNQSNDQENEEKHVKSIALKIAAQKIDQDSSDCSDSETFNLLLFHILHHYLAIPFYFQNFSAQLEKDILTLGNNYMYFC